MKKLILTTAICLVGAATVMAQGRIAFNNSSTTPLRISPNQDGSGAVILGTASTNTFGIGPAAAQIQLFAGLSSSSLSSVLIGTGANLDFVRNTTSLLGVLQGTFTGGGNLPLAGYDGSAPVYLQYRATATGAAGAWLNVPFSGESTIALVNLAVGASPATVVFAATPDASHFSSLTLVPVPEPSTFALAGLGAAALLIFRRRK